ncbi:MAG: putative carbon-nitrogen hydrolase family protein [Massilibacillus sp.]|jgi:predicted amidohydrolase|nr:putative carbon-nitrogen hydrolase family protein [Massilibacillus sp.]
MKLSLLQIHIVLGDFEKNKASVLAATEKAMQEKPDVLALPEMWNVGFFPKPIIDFADKNGQETRTFLSTLAKKYNVNIVGGSIANRIEEQLYNTSYTFNRQGEEIATYHKIHLFSPSKENQVFSAGDTLSIFMLDGVKCAVIICYDVRFCELVRMLALEGIDLLFVPAAWPLERLTHWQILNQARAIENQFFVAAINGSGSFNNFHLGGNSMLIDPWGNVLKQAGENEAIVTATLNLDVLTDIRSTINVFNDRKVILYKH